MLDVEASIQPSLEELLFLGLALRLHDGNALLWVVVHNLVVAGSSELSCPEGCILQWHLLCFLIRNAFSLLL